jgi:hypothetical protein
MPYEIRIQRNGLYVYNTETDKKMNEKPHSSMSKAKKHLAALHANSEESWKKILRKR